MPHPGITATAGIGTNLYLCKVAMDIVAKHIPADKNGVRIAELDEMSYRKTLWSHQPLTDFWRVGKGYAKKLEENGMFTMGDVARRSVTDEDLLYKLFGKNAELLIDHAWGWEPCTIEAVKAYKPESISFRAEGQERFTRSKTIGENYTEERIKERIAGRTPRRSQRQATPKGISLIGDIQERIRFIDSITSIKQSSLSSRKRHGHSTISRKTTCSNTTILRRRSRMFTALMTVPARS